MENDWRQKAVEDFCRENDVNVIVFDEWKTREKQFVLQKGKWKVIRNVCYDSIPTLLPTVLLNEMLQEVPGEEGEGC